MKKQEVPLSTIKEEENKKPAGTYTLRSEAVNYVSKNPTMNIYRPPASGQPFPTTAGFQTVPGVQPQGYYQHRSIFIFTIRL